MGMGFKGGRIGSDIFSHPYYQVYLPFSPFAIWPLGLFPRYSFALLLAVFRERYV
jgi:hypothetical protein